VLAGGRSSLSLGAGAGLDFATGWRSFLSLGAGEDFSAFRGRRSPPVTPTAALAKRRDAVDHLTRAAVLL
jgi:hypothetical protein